MIAVFGMPCVAKMRSSRVVTAVVVADFRISSSGYLDRWSMTTSRLSPEGKGPIRSVAKSLQGFEGIVVVFTLGLVDEGVTA